MRRTDNMSAEAQRACGARCDDGWHATMALMRDRAQPTFWITDGHGNTLDVCASMGQALQAQAWLSGAVEIWRRGPAGGLERLKVRRVA